VGDRSIISNNCFLRGLCEANKMFQFFIKKA